MLWKSETTVMELPMIWLFVFASTFMPGLMFLCGLMNPSQSATHGKPWTPLGGQSFETGESQRASGRLVSTLHVCSKTGGHSHRVII